MYYLGYDGGCVKFPIPQEYEHLYRDGTDLPMEFPVTNTCGEKVYISTC